ncbi:MAG: prefoldin subunit beta [Thermoplasmata archaeon]
MSISQEEIQNEIAKAQQMQQQLQNVISQKQQLDMKSGDVDRALEELRKLDDDTPIFRNLGGDLLVKVKDRKELIEDLEDELETLNVRVKSLSRQEEKLRKNFQELQQELTSKLSGMQGPMGGA